MIKSDKKIFGKINIEKNLVWFNLRPSEISEEKYYQITEVYEKKFYNDNWALLSSIIFSNCLKQLSKLSLIKIWS